MNVEKTVTSEMLAKETTYSGKIKLSNGKFRWENESPEKTLLLFDGKNLFSVQYPSKEFNTGTQVAKSKIDEKGKKQSIEYLAPNLNQCKSCHSFDGKFVPIGINLRQLNQAQAADNQLVKWQKDSLLSVPEDFDFSTAPHFPNPFLPENPDLETRARAYLDSNCGHCHNPHGPASTSGMFLNFDEKTPAKLGVEKLPVAAGRGSGGRKFGIVPGKPNESILIFRMENDDPGIRMPEVGRQILHREGVELVAEWIRKMGK